MPLHRRLPKRGFNNIFAIELNEVNLGRVQEALDKGKLDAKDVVDAEALVRAGVVRRAKRGVRLLGKGEIKAAVQFEVYGASRSAVEAVEKAGGSVKILAPQKSAEQDAALTPREIEVLTLLAEGASNKSIARRLGISIHTVKFHVASLLDKFEAIGRTDAVTQAVRLGVIQL